VLEDEEGTKGSNVVLHLPDLLRLLEEQKRGLAEKLDSFIKMFPDDKKLITFHEASILGILMNIRRVFFF
jgi:hypothetical protein